MRFVLFILLTIAASLQNFSQSVGLVLSGGGATGFAHIGVIKALEENDIPIDFITGTSAGALVGGLYASGYSPWEIEAIVLSTQFQLLSVGEIEERYKYFITQSEDDAELMKFRFAKDSIFQKSLPTNLLNPTYLDLELLHLLGLNPDVTRQSFDSLYVPFRCNASDIVTKKSVLFKSGDLNVAVRASMTYPFFISPIEVDGKLLFDGGLYNNFPAQDMYHEFNPDFIIGSNVSYNEAAPTDDNLMSQIKNMFSAHSKYKLPCEEGLIIEPDLGDIGTFDFDRIKDAIQIGYESTLAKIDSIKLQINRRASKEERKQARAQFNSRKHSIEIKQVQVTGLENDQGSYIERKLIKEKRENEITYDALKLRYLRLYQSEHILSIFPTIQFSSDSMQTLQLEIRKEKPFKTSFGGHYSSKPVNTGFLSISYSDFKITPLTVYANAYFGKFYGSVKTGLKFYLPTRTTAYLEPQFIMNRWDYFKSYATFFEDVKPSYIIQNEKFWSLSYHVATSNRSKIKLDFTNGFNEDTYYQTDNFTNLDTADYTSLLYYSPGFEFTHSSLNRKQFASAGTRILIRSRFVHAIERTIPGSTATFVAGESSSDIHNWAYLNINYQTYFVQKGLYRLGILLEAHYSIQPFFQNYTASLLSAQPFQPTPDSKTGFYDDFRANQYFAGGLLNIFTIKDLVDLRIEAYLFQPIQRINETNGMAEYGNFFESRFGLASISLIYHSIIGPLRATVNYFDSQTQLNPLSFQVSFGYVIFNRNAIR
jgi:NTE family protein